MEGKNDASEHSRETEENAWEQTSPVKNGVDGQNELPERHIERDYEMWNEVMSATGEENEILKRRSENEDNACNGVEQNDINNSNSPDINHGDHSEEQIHFQRIINAFKFYRNHSIQRINRSKNYVKSLNPTQQKFLTDYQKHLRHLVDCVDVNYEIIKRIIMDVELMFENSTHITKKGRIQPPTPLEMEKVQSTIKQFVRDWSKEGLEERKQCYDPIIAEIEKYYPLCEGETVRVLVPGAGLGRLAYEIAKRGYVCQGNEYSLFMLFASNFVLNKCKILNEHQIYPWIHHFVNNMSEEDQRRSVQFPDVNPSDMPTSGHFSMAAGDFLEIYTGDENTWDCVASCFFIDCSNNVIDVIETIFKILKPGGLWVNLGPLLYHFADIPNEKSIEPSYEMVRGIIKKIGFVFETETTHVKTTYAQNPHSMLRYEYDSVFFVCHKPDAKVDKTSSEVSK